MSYKHNIIKDRFDIAVTSADETFKATFELDKHADLLMGIAITSDSESSVYYRGSQKIQLNDQELFPEDFESKLLMTGMNVSPNDRMIKTGDVPTGNGRVEVWFKDATHPLQNFQPYRVSFYFFSKESSK